METTKKAKKATTEEVKELKVLTIGSEEFNKAFDSRLSRTSSKMLKGREYQLLNFVIVPANEQIKESWKGVQVINNSGSEITVSINTLLGVSVTGKAGAWKINIVKNPLFADFKELVQAVQNQSIVKVIDIEQLDSLKFGTTQVVKKDFPIFELV